MDDTADPAVEPYRALLDVAQAIASHRTLSDLFQDLTARLHRVLELHRGAAMATQSGRPWDQRGP
jgi:hypothetical protein